MGENKRNHKCRAKFTISYFKKIVSDSKIFAFLSLRLSKVHIFDFCIKINNYCLNINTHIGLGLYM